MTWTKCPHAKKYKALRPPTCGCDECKAKWNARLAEPPKISSGFAILDVKLGRKKLAELVEGQRMRVAVQIVGYIDGVHSRDDGTSIEFSITPTSVHTIGRMGPREPNIVERAQDTAAIAKEKTAEN